VTEEPVLTPIEPSIRDEEPPDDAILVIRAGPVTVEKILEHARREEGRFTFRGAPMASVSVDATIGDWTLEAILRDRLWSRTTYATTTVGALRRSGHDLLPTFGVPHYDLLLPAATLKAAGSLLATFGHGRAQPLPPEEVTMAKDAPVQIDIPCDIQQLDDTGYVWTFLDEARDPALVSAGAIVIAADEVDPVIARVVDLVPAGDRTIVHLEVLPGDPTEYAEALSRAHLLIA